MFKHDAIKYLTWEVNTVWSGYVILQKKAFVTKPWSSGLGVKVLDFQSSDPVFQTTGWLQV